MNYNSVDEIISAGITNMTIIRDNNKQDDGTDTLSGVSWFSFNDIVASNIYVSGNSYVGFNSDLEHLKVNRRDGALYSLYREEGTLYNYYKFLKVRWIGYSRYNQTTSAYSLIYDIILWDTGDISLHMVSIPTSYNTGTYSLTADQTYTYTVSAESPDITFLKTDSGFEINNNLISLEIPAKRLYLIQKESDYYTISDGALSKLDITELTSEIFLTYGIENLLLNLELLKSLENIQLFFWTDTDKGIPSKGLIIEGTPQLPQIIYYQNQILPEEVKIEQIKTIASEDVLFAVSCDEGLNWKYYDSENNIWNSTTEDVKGMTISVLNNILPNQWEEVITSTNLKFRGVLPTIDSFANSIYIKYID